MVGKTTSHADAVLNVLRGTTLAAPVTIYIALYQTTLPTDAGGGTESTYGADARKAIAFDLPGAGTDRQIVSTADVSWVSWSGVSPETFIAAGLHDHLSLDQLLYWNTITNRTINTGETATFAAGSVTVDES